MSCLLRRLYTKKTLQLVLDNTFKNFLHHKPNVAPIISSIYNPYLQTLRYKSKGKNKISQVTESETEEDKDEDMFESIKDKHTKTMKVYVPSMRVDTLLKAGLGLSRSKIEVLFYTSSIRLNYEKILKKSVNVQEGDEIDVIKGPSPTNPEFLLIARVEILSAKGEDDRIVVKIRRTKSLTIENYEGKNKWSHTQTQE